jgi:hypothetical protein
MTSPERIAALCDAVRYVVQRGLPGDFVECGVWRGGSMMAIAETLRQLSVTDRKLHLFDTFAGMTSPSDLDVDLFGRDASHQLQLESKQDARSVWCVSQLDEVKNNLRLTGYPPAMVHFHQGRVEETLPCSAIESIALLRLDTDWYESTRHELIHLYPRLVESGVLIIDDYGHWQGCRRAVDEYFRDTAEPILLNRIDYTGRIAVKTAQGILHAA